MNPPVDSRRRLWLLGVCLLVIALGLGSRSGHLPLPAFIARYAGDTLWAVLVFLLLAIALPRRPVLFLAAAALAIAFSVEILQLYQAPWINSVRATLPGRLILGQGFLFSDLLCYTIGIALAAALYHLIVEKSHHQLASIAGCSIVVIWLVSVIACNFGAGGQLFWFVQQLPGRDKTAHFLLMGAVAFLLVLMLVPKLKGNPGLATLIIIASVTLIATAEEASQYFLASRTFSMKDLWSNIAGIWIFGALAYPLVREKKIGGTSV